MTTKHIRIAVTVDSKGNWNAVSWGGPAYSAREDAWKDAAYEGLESQGPEGFVWVEVDVPLPIESTTVQGTVSEICSPTVDSAP